MDLVIIQELVQTAGTRVIILILLVHDCDVIDELGQKRLHSLDRSRKLHDLIKGLAHLYFLH